MPPNNEAVVIVGAGLRLPGGVDTMPALWDALCDPNFDAFQSPCESGADGGKQPGALPPRWPYGAIAPHLKMGMVSVDALDAAFFGIPPAEAVSLRPQTRLLLETALEAMENSGERPSELEGKAISVFTACAEDGFATVGEANRGKEFYDRHFHLARSDSTIAGRLSNRFDWTGPCMNVDTACSGGLTALHLGANSILNEEADAALVGAATTHLWPDTIRFLEQAGILSKSARCAPFSQDADGYVPSEGAICLLLKRRSAAVAEGNRILAEVCSTVASHGGKSAGLMRPTARGQTELLARAQRAAGLTPSDVDVIEAHGTGTVLGDEVEMEALCAAFGASPRARPVLVSTAKSRFGHGHEIAGLLGVLKAILQGSHGVIPPHGRMKAPRDFSSIEKKALQQVRVVRHAEPLRGPEVVTGVFSFGYAGSLAHAILRVAVVPHQERSPEQHCAQMPQPALLAVSARSDASLVRLLRRHRRHFALRPCLQACGSSLSIWTAAANATRDVFRRRAAVAFVPGDDVVATLDRTIERIEATAPTKGSVGGASSAGAKLTFVFTGHGSKCSARQHEELVGKLPGYGEAVRRVESEFAVVSPGQTFDMRQALQAEEDREDSSCFVLFCYQYALAEALKSLGVTPRRVLGCSLGEWPAACVAGALSLRSALLMLRLREEFLAAAAASAAADEIGSSTAANMVAVLAEPAEAEEALLRASLFGFAEAAVRFQPRVTTFAVPTSHLDAVLGAWDAAGIRHSLRKIPYAFHSRHVQSASDALLDAAAEITLGGDERVHRDVEVFSGLTGGKLPEGAVLDASFWAVHVRRPCRFLEASQKAMEVGTEHDGMSSILLLDLSPDSSTFKALVKHAPKKHTIVTATAPRSASESAMNAVLRAAAVLFESGVVDSTLTETLSKGSLVFQHPKMLGRIKAAAADLPLYPFDRRRYWPTLGRDCNQPLLHRYGWAHEEQRITTRPHESQPLISAPSPVHPGTHSHDLDPAPEAHHLSWHSDPALDLRHASDAPPRGASRQRVIVVSSEAWMDLPPGALLTHPAKGKVIDAIHSLVTSDASAEAVTVVLEAKRVQDRCPLSLAQEEVRCAFAVVQELLALSGSTSSELRLVGVTRGMRIGLDKDDADAYETGSATVAEEVAHGAFFGFLKTARSEAVGRVQVTTVDFPLHWQPIETQRCLTAAMSSSTQREALFAAPIHAVRGPVECPMFMQPQFSRASERAHDQVTTAATPPRLPGTYLVLGGLGDVGMQLVPWLSSLGVQRIIVVGQRARGEVAERLGEMQRRVAVGCGLEYVPGDCRDGDEIRRLVTYADATPEKPLRGIVHLATRIADGAISRHSWETFSSPLDNKMSSAWHLHEATLARKLETFLLFSSGSSSYGNPGQSNYVAANTFLEQLAVSRAARRLPALCILLGPWRESAKAKAISKPLLLTFPMASHATYLPPFGRSLQQAISPRSIVVLLIPIDPIHLARQPWAKRSFLWKQVISSRREGALSATAVVASERSPDVDETVAVSTSSACATSPASSTDTASFPPSEWGSTPSSTCTSIGASIRGVAKVETTENWNSHPAFAEATTAALKQRVPGAEASRPPSVAASREAMLDTLRDLMLLDEGVTPDWRAGFAELGMDSLSFLSFTARMIELTGQRLPMDFIDTRSLDEVAAWYAQRA